MTPALLLLATALAAPEPVADPDTILGDWPDYVDPIEPGDYDRYLDDAWVDDAGADLLVRAWRYSAELGGVVESENQLRSDATALVVVHPWGIDDGQGWSWPQAYNAYGYVFEGLYEDNQLYLRQVEDVARGLVDGLRGRLPVVVYALPGWPDEVRTRRYRSFDALPSAESREEAQAEIEAYLGALSGSDWPSLIPVVAGLDAAPDDVVSYDDAGWATLQAELEALGVEHVLLAGWATDMCVVSTTAGYLNLAGAFDVFLVGDATMAAWPLTAWPPNGYVPVSTLDALLDASTLEGLAITQASWLTLLDRDPAGGPDWRGEAGSWAALFDHWQARPAEEHDERHLLRVPDWSSAGAPALLGGPFDADALALSGQLGGRVNVLTLPEGQALTLAFDLDEPPPALELQVRARWAPDREGEALQLTLRSEAGSTALELVGETEDGEGWRTSTLTGSLEASAEMSLELSFSAGEGWLDALSVDGRPVAEEAADSGGAETGAADSGAADSGAADSGGAETALEPADDELAAENEEPEGREEARSCGCAGAGEPGTGWLLALATLGWRRRRAR